jgi:hypothetical protein
MNHIRTGKFLTRSFILSIVNSIIWIWICIWVVAVAVSHAFTQNLFEIRC